MADKFISVLPFALDDASKAIMHVLTCKDGPLDTSTVLNIQHNKKSDSDAVFEFLKKKFEISVDEAEKMKFLNNLFYLGKLIARYGDDIDETPLYGINITPFIKSINAESLKDIYEVTPYANLIKDPNIDLRLAASLFFLVSYLA